MYRLVLQLRSGDTIRLEHDTFFEVMRKAIEDPRVQEGTVRSLAVYPFVPAVPRG